AQVAIDKLALRVSGLGFELLDFRIDVAIADQDVGPAIVIHVEETAAPAEVLSVGAKAGGEGCVFETGAAEIVIERGSVSGEVGFDEIEVAIEIVVGGGDTHAGLRLSIGTKSASG